MAILVVVGPALDRALLTHELRLGIGIVAEVPRATRQMPFEVADRQRRGHPRQIILLIKQRTSVGGIGVASGPGERIDMARPDLASIKRISKNPARSHIDARSVSLAGDPLDRSVGTRWHRRRRRGRRAP